MRIDSLIYRLAYRGGTAPWDTGQPHPELDAMIGERPAGRALDLGCGSGANAVELARRGWDVVGVDFVAAAIEAANRRARDAGATARFVTGDVSALRACGIRGPFDLIIDVGCYHSIPIGIRDAYAREAAALTLPGADLRLAGIGHAPLVWRLMRAEGVSAAELRRRFEPQFTLLDSRATTSLGRASGFVMYHLVRQGETSRSTAQSRSDHARTETLLPTVRPSGDAEVDGGDRLRAAVPREHVDQAPRGAGGVDRREHPYAGPLPSNRVASRGNSRESDTRVDRISAS